MGQAGDDYFVEIRARAPAAMPSNYSSFFSVIDVSLGPYCLEIGWRDPHIMILSYSYRI